MPKTPKGYEPLADMLDKASKKFIKRMPHPKSYAGKKVMKKIAEVIKEGEDLRKEIDRANDKLPN